MNQLTDYEISQLPPPPIEWTYFSSNDFKAELKKKKIMKKNIDFKTLYKNEDNRISWNDKLKPNYKRLNSEMLNQILLINPKLNDENQNILKEFISAISHNALEEGQIDQSALYLKDLFKPNIIKKGGNDAINKRLKKRRIRFTFDSGL